LTRIKAPRCFDLIKAEVNVKEIVLLDDALSQAAAPKTNFKVLGTTFGKDMGLIPVKRYKVLQPSKSN
jgi:isoleucyl-tRNA synthetase